MLAAFAQVGSLAPAGMPGQRESGGRSDEAHASGFEPPEDLEGLYALSSLVAVPSRYEGFGLPAVEAMASGSPLVLADTSSLPEVGGDAARYFPPGDDRTLAGVLSEILANASAQAELRSRGLLQARRFTWPGYARANLEAYRAVLR